MPKSSLWRGWFSYDGEHEQHVWQATWSVDSGRLVGRGHDDLGTFSLLGTVDDATGTVRWVKHYEQFGGDPYAAVHYRGRLVDDKLEGEWKLPDGSRGRFGAEKELEN
jgi:hypothetical protein